MQPGVDFKPQLPVHLFSLGVPLQPAASQRDILTVTWRSRSSLVFKQFGSIVKSAELNHCATMKATHLNS